MKIAKTKSKDITPLPFGVYLWTVIMITVIGLIDSIYLSVSHYRVYTDIGYKSFCAISRAINCDTISQSPHSIFLNLPVPVWGVIGYAFLLVCLLGAGSKEAGKIRIWSIVFWISLAFSCYSVILAMISTYIIGSYCIMCIVAYGVNLVLLFYAWIIRKRFSESGLIKDTGEDIHYLWKKRTKSLVIISFFSCAVFLTWFYFPAYWNFQPPRLSDDIPKGVTASGHPWVGAKRPVLEIFEFSDYQCFQCKKMHFFLRQLVADNPEKIRIVHRNYPMDHQFNPIVKDPFHVGSGKMALLAVYAVSKNKFWQMNDLLFGMAGKKKKISLRKLAQKLNLDTNELVRSLNARKIRYHLQKDIFTGNKLGIMGTPAYVINGKVYLGSIPAELLKTGMRK